MLISTVLICRTEDRRNANALSVALGYSPSLPGDVFAIGLAPDGKPPATHFGAHAWASESFKMAVEALQAGSLPPGVVWEDYGLTADIVLALGQSMIISFSSPDGPTNAAHFNAVIADNGLKKIDGGGDEQLH